MTSAMPVRYKAIRNPSTTFSPRALFESTDAYAPASRGRFRMGQERPVRDVYEKICLTSNQCWLPAGDHQPVAALSGCLSGAARVAVEVARLGQEMGSRPREFALQSHRMRGEERP